MHDGAPPHFSMEVQQFLCNQYPRRSIGRGRNAPVSWPPRSPDLNSLDFYFWGHLKSMVYATPVHSRQELQNRILTSANIIRQNRTSLNAATTSLIRRVRLCLDTDGGHFEHFL